MSDKIVNGKYTNAIIKSNDAEDYAVAQIEQLCNLRAMENSKIICMPDIHPGKVAPIGFTCKLPDENPLMPALIGNDIGCGVLCAEVKIKGKPDFKKLDTVIRENIGIRHVAKKSLIEGYYLDHIANIDFDKSVNTLCTLGGGNHFIELDQDKKGRYFLVIHSGSRNFGAAIYDYYMKLAQKESEEGTPFELSYLTDNDSKRKYILDCQSAYIFAQDNRMLILDNICKNMKWKQTNYIIDTAHNSLTKVSDHTIINKGSICYMNRDSDIAIPINMRDGVLIVRAKKDYDHSSWNWSTSHGSGRVLSRSEVKDHHTVSEFKKAMEGIYSPSISKDTLDEAPFAYRSKDIILNQIENMNIVNQLKPVYNYKGGSK